MTKNRIREFRLKAGYSQGKLARESGVSVTNLSLMETWKSGPSLGSLEKISAVLGVPICKLNGMEHDDDTPASE